MSSPNSLVGKTTSDRFLHVARGLDASTTRHVRKSHAQVGGGALFGTHGVAVDVGKCQIARFVIGETLEKEGLAVEGKVCAIIVIGAFDGYGRHGWDS